MNRKPPHQNVYATSPSSFIPSNISSRREIANAKAEFGVGADKKHKPPFLVKKLKVQSKTTEKLSMTNTDTYCRYLWISSKTAECSLPGAVEVCSTPLCSARLHSCYTSFFVYTSLNMPSDKHLQLSPTILCSFITFGLVDRAYHIF